MFETILDADDGDGLVPQVWAQEILSGFGIYALYGQEPDANHGPLGAGLEVCGWANVFVEPTPYGRAGKGLNSKLVGLHDR